MRVLCRRSRFCMCIEKDYILLPLRETEIGFNVIRNYELQKQPLMPSLVSFRLYMLAGKSYYSGPREYRYRWQLSSGFAQVQQANGLELELQLQGRSFTHKDFTADKPPNTGPFILKFFWTSTGCFWELVDTKTLESQSSKFYWSFTIQPWEPHKLDQN